jgi:hypothetical protein
VSTLVEKVTLRSILEELAQSGEGCSARSLRGSD